MATTIAKLAIQTTLDSSGVEIGAAKTQGAVQRLGASLGAKLSGAATAAGGALLAAATAAVSLSNGVEQISAAAERIDRLAKLSDRYDIETEALQRLSIAADLAGVDQEKLAKAIQKMTTTVGGGGMPLDKRFLQIADAIAEIEAPSERASKTMEIFGEEGVELQNLLMSGAKEIEQAGKIVDRFGIGISRDEAARVETMNDAWTETNYVLSGIWNKLTVQIAPAVTDFLHLALQGLEDIGAALSQVGVSWDDVGRIARVAMTQVAWSVATVIIAVDKMAERLARAQAVLLRIAAFTSSDPWTKSLFLQGAEDLEKQADEFAKRADRVAEAVARLASGERGGGAGTRAGYGAAVTDLEMSRTSVAGVQRGTLEQIKLMMGINAGASDPAKVTASATKRTADGVDKLIRILGDSSGAVVAADF